MLPAPVKVYYGRVIKEGKVPSVIPVEDLTSGWQQGQVFYAFSKEFRLKLDEMSSACKRHLAGLAEDPNEPVLEPEPEDDCEQQPDVPEVEPLAMQHRRRILRNTEGQILTSYRDLSNPQSTRQSRRRLQNLGQEENETQAERHSLEFEQTAAD